MEKEDQVAIMCLRAAWQRLEKFLQASSRELVDDLGSVSSKNKNKLELGGCSSWRKARKCWCDRRVACLTSPMTMHHELSFDTEHEACTSAMQVLVEPVWKCAQQTETSHSNRTSIIPTTQGWRPALMPPWASGHPPGRTPTVHNRGFRKKRSWVARSLH